MRDVGIVRGSAAQAKPVVINVDTVYVHTNIHKLETENGQEEYEYNEVQYDKNEYLTLMVEELNDIQLALIELYEGGTLNA